MFPQMFCKLATSFKAHRAHITLEIFDIRMHFLMGKHVMFRLETRHTYLTLEFKVSLMHFYMNTMTCLGLKLLTTQFTAVFLFGRMNSFDVHINFGLIPIKFRTNRTLDLSNA